jgi:hypothetical protein
MAACTCAPPHTARWRVCQAGGAAAEAATNSTRRRTGLKSKKKKKKDAPSDPHMIPTDTKVVATIEPNEASHCVELVLTASHSETVIQLVAVFCEQVFEGESHVVVRR